MTSPDTVPAHLVERLDRIFADVPGVDTVELGALLFEITGNSGIAPHVCVANPNSTLNVCRVCCRLM